MEKFKYIVIGFGKGGKTLAKQLAQRGEQVLVIEESAEMYGGTCINVGCIPSKVLVTQSERHIPLENAAARKTQLVQALRNKNYHMIADEPTATVWNGKARFVSDYELEVTLADGSVQHVVGEHIIINTGATSSVPASLGVQVGGRILTSREALNLADKPASLVIVGSGYIGLEFASMFTNFGTKVQILEVADSFIPREDAEIAALVKQDMEVSGVQFAFGVKDLQLSEDETSVTVRYQHDGENQTIQADYVLLATGRRPNTAGLGLENTSIEVNERGAIVIDEHLRTKVANIWAVGDVTGGLQFTYISLDDFRIVADQLFGEGQRTTQNRPVVPYTVFLTPSLSVVGLNEQQAVAAGYEVKVFKLPVAAIPKAHILGETRGLFKVVVNQADNTILGASLYGIESHEVINLLTLALQAKIPYTQLKNQLYTHPTISEALNDLFK